VAFKAWQVRHADGEYYVELGHGTPSGKRKASVGGQVVIEEGYTFRTSATSLTFRSRARAAS